MYAKKLHSQPWYPRNGRLVMSQRPWTEAADKISDNDLGDSSRETYKNRVRDLQHGLPSGRPYPEVPGALPLHDIESMMKEYMVKKWKSDEHPCARWWTQLCKTERERLAKACPTCTKFAAELVDITISQLKDSKIIQKQKKDRKKELVEQIKLHYNQYKGDRQHQPVSNHSWPGPDMIKVDEKLIEAHTRMRFRQQEIESAGPEIEEKQLHLVPLLSHTSTKYGMYHNLKVLLYMYDSI